MVFGCLKRYGNNERGKVLLVVLALSVLIQLFGGYLLMQTVFVGKHVRMETLRIQSEYLTEAGFQWALSQMSLSRVDGDGEMPNAVSVPIRDIYGADFFRIDDAYRFSDSDIFRINFLPLDERRMKVTVVTVWSSNELEYAVQHGMDAVVDRETFNVEKRE